MSVLSIYDDLSTTDFGEQVAQLQEQNEKLLRHIQTLDNDIMKLCTELTEMKAAKDILERKISRLLNMAKREEERRQRMIADLCRLYDLIFKQKTKRPYTNNENKELKTANVAHKRSRNEATSESDTSKRSKYEFENIRKHHNPPSNENTKIKEKIKPVTDLKDSKTYSKPKVKQEDSNIKSKICSKEESEKSNVNIDTFAIGSQENVEITANPTITLESHSVNSNGTNELRVEIATTSNTNNVEEIQINAVNDIKDDNSVNQNVVVNNCVSDGQIVNNSQDTQLLCEPNETVIQTLESHSVNSNGTNELRVEIATTSNTNKVEEIQINAVNDINDDNSVNQNVVVSNCVSDGQIVNNSQITVDTQLLREPNENVIQDEPVNVIQSCNISHGERARSKKRRRCIIRIISP